MHSFELGRATRLLLRKPLATNNAVRNHVGHYRFAWNFATLEHHGIGFEAIQKPSHNHAEVEYSSMGRIGGALSRAPTSI